MKAKLKALLPGFTGNMDDVVVYYNSKLNKMIVRRKVKPKRCVSTAHTTLIFALARRIGLSAAWHQDCQRYIDFYNAKNRKQGRALASWPAVWLKLMTAQTKARPDLDFAVLSRQELMQLDLPCLSIAGSVEAGFLEPVMGWQSLNALV